MSKNIEEARTKIGIGSEYYISYVPENANSSTPIHVFASGAGDISEYAASLKRMMESGKIEDCIIVVLNDSGGEGATNLGQKYAEAIKGIADNYNIPSSNVTLAGFSRGTNVGATTEAALYNMGFELPCFINISGNSSNVTLDYMKSTSGRENTCPYLYFSDGTNSYSNNLKYISQNWNGPVYEVYKAGHHEYVPFYDQYNLLNFLNGKGDLENTGDLLFRKWNKDGTYEEVTYEEFKEAMKITSSYASPATAINLLGDDLTVVSDPKTLGDYMQNIKFAIKNSSGLTASTSASYSSTTTVPPLVTEEINNYLKITSMFLGKIASDVLWIENVTKNINDMDDYLAKRLEELRNVEALNVGSIGKPDSVEVEHAKA